MGSGKKKHRPQKSMPNVGSLTRENSAAAKPKRRLSMLAASISRRKPTEFTSEEKVEGGEKESFGNWPNSEGVGSVFFLSLCWVRGVRCRCGG